MTVYVVHDHRKFDRETGETVAVYDISPAEQFGQLVYLLPPTATPWASHAILDRLWEGLQGFRDGDYLLMIGNPVLCGLATSVAAEVNDGRVGFLQWSGRDRSYIPVVADIFDVGSRGPLKAPD